MGDFSRNNLEEHFDDTYETSEQIDAKSNRNQALVGAAVSTLVGLALTYFSKTADKETARNLYHLASIVPYYSAAVCLIGVVFNQVEYYSRREE